MTDQRNALSVAAGWDEEREARLTKLWKDGLSCGGIAKVLGVTRNSVIGKARRMKLAPHSAAVQRSNQLNARAERAAVERAARPSRPRKAADTAGEGRVVHPRAPALPLPPMTFVDVTTARPWTTREFGECAFPVSGDGADTLSCCAKVDAEQTYCRAHRAIMYAPRPKKKPRLERLRTSTARRWAA